MLRIFTSVKIQPATLGARGQHANHYTTEAVMVYGKFMNQLTSMLNEKFIVGIFLPHR
jgi:hypothetical protein